MIFGSGMAAISTSLLAFLNSGDHIILQNDIYGGTRNLVEAQFKRYGIEYSFTEGLEVEYFEQKIQKYSKDTSSQMFFLYVFYVFFIHVSSH